VEKIGFRHQRFAFISEKMLLVVSDNDSPSPSARAPSFPVIKLALLVMAATSCSSLARAAPAVLASPEFQTFDVHPSFPTLDSLTFASSAPPACYCGSCGCCQGCSFSAMNNSCTSCVAGSFASDCKNRSVCEACPRGFFCPNSQMTAPLQCAEGTFSAASAIECTSCTGGTSDDEISQCPKVTAYLLFLEYPVYSYSAVTIVGLLHFTNAFSVYKYVAARQRRILNNEGKPNKHKLRNIPCWVILAILFGPLVWLMWSFYTRKVLKWFPNLTKPNPKNDHSDHDIKQPLLSQENPSIQSDPANEKPGSIIYACATGNTSIQSHSVSEEPVSHDLSSESIQQQSLTGNTSVHMDNDVEPGSAYAPAHGLVYPLLSRSDVIFIPGVQPIDGGMGTVLQAMHHGVHVAVKSPKILSPMKERSKSSFLKEINMIKCAQHYACVGLRGAVIDEEGVMLVTEWMEGGNLYDALDNHKVRPLTPFVRVKIARIIADGLQYLHSINIIHRDIKSPNILLTRDYNAKLCDFGLAKLQTMTDTKSKSVLAATFRWQAPEVLCSGKSYSEASDVYSFGIVMWELMTCDVPFPDCESIPQFVGKLNQRERPSIPSPLPTGFSEEYVDLMQRCWHQVTYSVSESSSFVF
jgi:hypothetical protein